MLAESSAPPGGGKTVVIGALERGGSKRQSNRIYV
jgi:hypothetical protein